MKKYIIPFMIVVGLFFLGCKKTVSDSTHLEMAKTYYEALDQSDIKTLSTLLADSITSKELEYEVFLSKKGYMDLQRWDSIFQPTYKVLDIEEVEEAIKLKISKACFRTLFLNGEPIITKESITFSSGKIQRVAIDEYVVFNTQRWDTVRANLVNYINLNHKALNGFLTDQTVQGALNYTKAINLYMEDSITAKE